MKLSLAKKPNFSPKRGDLFQIGEHRLLCGDATDPVDVKRLLGHAKINLICTDPPYGVDYVAAKAGLGQQLAMPKTIANDHEQSDEEYREFTAKWLRAVASRLSAKNSAYIFNSDKMIFALREGMQDAGFKFAQLLVWVKSRAVMGRLDYMPQHELVAYGWYGRHDFRMGKDKSVITCPRPSRSPLHPTMKPVPLIRRLIINGADINGAVYDPFGGSGTTMVACWQARRQCFMIELDPEYCGTILERMQKLSGLVPKKL